MSNTKVVTFVVDVDGRSAVTSGLASLALGDTVQIQVQNLSPNVDAASLKVAFFHRDTTLGYVALANTGTNQYGASCSTGGQLFANVFTNTFPNSKFPITIIVCDDVHTWCIHNLDMYNNPLHVPSGDLPVGDAWVTKQGLAAYLAGFDALTDESTTEQLYALVNAMRNAILGV